MFQSYHGRSVVYEINNTPIKIRNYLEGVVFVLVDDLRSSHQFSAMSGLSHGLNHNLAVTVMCLILNDTTQYLW